MTVLNQVFRSSSNLQVPVVSAVFPWAVLTVVGAGSVMAICHCAPGSDGVETTDTVEAAATLALEDLRNPENLLARNSWVDGERSIPPPWYRYDEITCVTTSLPAVTRWADQFPKWTIDPASVLGGLIGDIGLRNGQVHPFQALEAVVGGFGAEFSFLTARDRETGRTLALHFRASLTDLPLFPDFSAILDIGFGTIIRRLCFPVPAAFSAEVDAKIAVCYLALLPGHLEKLLEVLQMMFDAATWERQKMAYARTQLKMIQDELFVHRKPALDWAFAEVLGNQCKLRVVPFLDKC